MTSQSNKLTSNLYYADSKPTLASLPVDDIIKTNAIRENNYLKTKETINLLDTFQRSLPKDLSPDVYYNLIGKTKEALDSITPDNYADKTIDATQLAYDVANKYGGNELLEQQKLLDEAKKKLDEAYKNKEIVDPAFLNYKKQLLKQSIKPLSVDENGFITKPTSPNISYAKYFDAQDFLDKFMKDFKPNVDYTINSDGTLTILRDMPGYLGLKSGEIVTEERLLGAGIKALSNNKEYQAYLQDYLPFINRGVEPTAAYLAENLPESFKAQFFGDKNADEYTIYNAIQNGTVDPKQVQQILSSFKEIGNQVQPYADKYSYKKDEIKMFTDELLLKSLEAQKQINIEKAKAQAKAVQPDTAVVTLEPFTTQMIVNPKDIATIQTNKQALSNQRQDLQIQINKYKQQLKDNPDKVDYETLNRLQKEQDDLDYQIGTLEEQERGLGRAMFDKAKINGVDLESIYNKNIKASSNGIITKNSITLRDTNFKVDITSKIKFDKAGKPYIEHPNILGVRNQYIGEKGLGRNIIKQGDKYFFINDDESGRSDKIIINYKDYINPDGTLKADVILTDKNDISKFYKAPSKEDFYKITAKAFGDGEGMSLISNKSGKLYEYDNGKNTYKIGYSVYNEDLPKALDKIRNTTGDYDLELAQPLSYLLVTGDTNKSSTKIYQNYEKAARRDFLTTPEQYSVNIGGKLQGLGDYLKEKYGIPSLSKEYIDWDKMGFRTLIQSDRKHGQIYGSIIHLTPKGLEEVKDKNPDVFNNTNSIKVALVNPNKEYNAQIKDQMIRSYPSLMNQDSEQAVDMKNQMGFVYISNSPEGKQIDSLNLYTMSAGDSKNIKIRNQDYQINSLYQGDLDNMQFHLSKASGNTNYVYATNGRDKTWKPLSEVEKDNKTGDTWRKIIFESPSDIKSVIGASLLEKDVRNNTNANTNINIENPYETYMNNSSFYNNTPQGTVISTYKKTVSTLQKQYQSPSTITIQNIEGKQVKIDARINSNDLFDLRNKYNSIIDKGVQYPYIHKSIESNLDSLLSSYALTVTGGLRGENTHDGLSDSAENSLHKYGFGVDFRADEQGEAFLKEIQNNPDLAKKYGIINIKKHGKNPHIHVEFAPKTI